MYSGYVRNVFLGLELARMPRFQVDDDVSVYPNGNEKSVTNTSSLKVHEVDDLRSRTSANRHAQSELTSSPIYCSLGGVTVNINDQQHLSAHRATPSDSNKCSNWNFSCTCSKNPARCVDVISRVAFRVLFAIFNAGYWTYFG